MDLLKKLADGPDTVGSFTDISTVNDSLHNTCTMAVAVSKKLTDYAIVIIIFHFENIHWHAVLLSKILKILMCTIHEKRY